MSIETKMFPRFGGWTPSYKELFLEITGSDGKKYRTGLKPKDYPFYAYAPVIDGVVQYDSAKFYVDKNGNLVATNAIISGVIIAGTGSSIDWSYIKNVLVQDAQIQSLSANKIIAGTGIINDLTIKATLTMGDGITYGKIITYDFANKATGIKIEDGATPSIIIKGGTISGGNIEASNIFGGTITSPQLQTSSGYPKIIFNEGYSTNSIRFYDANQAKIAEIGISTSKVINITPTSSINIGFNFNVSSNISAQAINIYHAGTDQNNLPLINVESAGTNSLFFGIIDGLGKGIYIQRNAGNPGSNPLIDIQSFNSITTDSVMFNIYRSGEVGKSIGIKIQQGLLSNPNGLIGIEMNLSSSNNPALIYAFSFQGSEVVNSAVGGLQDKKIRIRIGTTDYYIPCYTA